MNFEPETKVYTTKPEFILLIDDNRISYIELDNGEICIEFYEDIGNAQAYPAGTDFEVLVYKIEE